MLRVNIILCLCFLGVFATVPDYFHICKQNDENVSDCIKKSIEVLREPLNAGIADLGVPPLDPIEIDDVFIDKAYQLNLTNVKIAGTGKFEIKEFKAEVGKFRFAAIVYVPKVELQAIQTLNLETDRFPLQLHGSAPILSTFYDINITFKMKGRHVEIDGKNYLKFDSFENKIVRGKKRELEVGDMFKDNPTLSEIAKNFIMENADLFINDLLPGVEESLGRTLTRNANKITTRFTFEELFPLS